MLGNRPDPFILVSFPGLSASFYEFRCHFVVVRPRSHMRAHLLVFTRAPGLGGEPPGGSSCQMGLGAQGAPPRPSVYLAFLSLLGLRKYSPGAKKSLRLRFI